MFDPTIIGAGITTAGAVTGSLLVYLLGVRKGNQESENKERDSADDKYEQWLETYKSEREEQIAVNARLREKIERLTEEFTSFQRESTKRDNLMVIYIYECHQWMAQAKADGFSRPLPTPPEALRGTIAWPKQQPKE